MGRAAVNFELEGGLRSAQLVDNLIDHRERIARIFGAVCNQEPALYVLGPSGCVIIERTVDRDIGQDRRAGRGELDADTG